MSSATLAAPGWQGGWRDGASYGALGLPLAFVALPLYVLLPNHYASVHGVPLAALGAVLLGARLFDAVLDPLIGRWADAAAAAGRLAWLLVPAGVLLAFGFHALFFPPVSGTAALLAWCGAMLVVSYLGYSTLSVVHQAWGARLGGGETQRAHIVGWREGSALCGVIVASVLPTLAGLGAMTATFALLLLVGLLLLGQAPRPVARHGGTAHPRLLLPWSVPEFRRLLAVFVLNGIASAVPATLLLFFVRDLLRAQAFEGAFLAGYFIAAALSIPLWLRGVARFGLARCWLASMLLAIAAFGWSALLGAGDVRAFGLICLASGLALGADLTLPGAMLAGIIQRAGHSGRAEGAYMGWWNFAGKLNLALAAGLALPALQAFGYAPGSSDTAALHALALAYALLPCALKLLAAGWLYFGWMRQATARGDG